MDYTEFTYLWPPRPETNIPKSAIAFIMKQGYCAQVKKNGTCTVIFCRGKEVIFKTRHPDLKDGEHSAWTPKPEHIKFFSGLSKKWNVFVAELIHSKTPHIKDQLYIFDQIVHEGVQLVGKTFIERQELMQHRWPDGQIERDQIRLSKHVSLARIFTDAAGLWDNLQAEDEGLVFKRLNAKLEACRRQMSNSGWQVKCRRPHANYSF